MMPALNKAPVLFSCSDRVVVPKAEAGRARCLRHTGAHYERQSYIHTLIAKMPHWNKADASVMAKLDHLPLFTIKQSGMVLHADKLGPSVLLGTELHQCELIGPRRASPNIADLVYLDQIMESFHGLFNRECKDRSGESV